MNVSGVVVPSISSNTALTVSKISCSSGALRFFVGDSIVSIRLSFLALLDCKRNSGARRCGKEELDNGKRKRFNPSAAGICAHNEGRTSSLDTCYSTVFRMNIGQEFNS